MTIPPSRLLLSAVSLTFPRLLSRLFSPSEPPFWAPRNLARFRLLASDSPLCLVFVGYPLRSRHTLQSSMTSIFLIVRCPVPARNSSLAARWPRINCACRAMSELEWVDCLSWATTHNSHAFTRTQKHIAYFELDNRVQSRCYELIVGKGVHRCRRVEEPYASNRCSLRKN
jgi:hypothetical protein